MAHEKAAVDINAITVDGRHGPNVVTVMKRLPT